MRKQGRPKHEPTEKSRIEVSALSGFGARHKDIAAYLGISEGTLRKHYKEELELGIVKANLAVAKTLHALAVGGDSRSCMFWLKTRAGWRETDRRELTGADGAPLIPPKLEVVFMDESGDETEWRSAAYEYGTDENRQE